MNKLINNLSRKINFNEFDAVLINMDGGKFLFEEIKKRKDIPNRVDEIEYHQPKGGFGAIVVIPVPEDLRNKKVVIIEDVLDSGGVLNGILESVSKDSVCVALVQKNGIDGQIDIKNKIVGVKIDNVWVGGCGMNLETEGDGLPENFLRKYSGLVVKIL